MPARTLLVVEDDGPARAALVGALRYGGHQVLSAATGVEALRLIEAGPVDLVLLDLMLPEMSGLELLKRMRSNPRLAPMRVGLLSAERDLEKIARKLRLVGYVRKPVGVKELLDATARMLEGEAFKR